jgi:MinD-like ATPase involved in chromosome partitioning or flagellar assembly
MLVTSTRVAEPVSPPPSFPARLLSPNFSRSLPMFCFGQSRLILGKLTTILYFIVNWRYETMAALDNLKREVEETKSINQSVIALLQGLKAKLDEAIASGDPAVLQALADSLDTEQQGLAAAITANTPEDEEQS